MCIKDFTVGENWALFLMDFMNKEILLSKKSEIFCPYTKNIAFRAATLLRHSCESNHFVPYIPCNLTMY